MNEEQQIELKNLENLKAQLEELKKSKSSSKLAIAKTTADIGYSCNNLDKYEEALDYYKESLKNYTQYNLADNYQSDIAEIYMCMGTIYDRQGNYSKALNRLQMSLDICSKKQSNDSNRANVLNSIGLVYMNLGKDDEALDYLYESLRIKKRIFDRDSPEIATAYGNIGIVYKKKGELDDALNYLNIALGIKENAKPINYPSLAGTLNNIGLVYFNQGKFDDALNYYERSLEIREKRLASNHPEIGRTLVNIGDLYFIDGDYEKALEYFNKSHNIYKNFPLPANHPDIGRVLNKIGHVYKEERNYEEALQFFKDSLDVYQKSELLSDHSDIVETYNIIGLVYKEQGQYEQALKYLKDSGQISACLRQIRKDRKDKEDGLADAKKQFKKQAPIEVISDDLLGRTFNERYKTVKILGSGTYGQVYKIHDSKESKIDKVIKITKKDLVAENELDHLSNINHENIVKYFHSFQMKKSDQVFLCIIIEYCSSDLRKQIDIKTKFAEKQMFDWTFQTTKALIYLNSKKIIHRDVKPENILLSENETIKLSDFGLATLTSNSSFSSSYAGTKSYMSPELYKCVYKDNNYRYTYNTDIWSLGCVLYELMFLKKAFPQGQSRDPKVPNLGNSLLFTPILELMLVKDPEKRIKSKDLDAKLSDVENFIEKQLKNKT